MKKKIIDIETVKNLYINEELSLAKVGEIVGINASTVKYILEKNNIETRKRAIKFDIHDKNNIRRVKKLYNHYKMSLNDIAKELNTHAPIILSLMKVNKLERRGLTDHIKEVNISLDDITELYYDSKLSLDEVAKRLEVSQSSVLAFMSKHNLPRRSFKKNHMRID